jgi:prepilin-type N-terminal cleavage/methylation domain-containing protein
MLKAIHSEKGFTLIELLVVIGILATLAGVVTLGVTQFIGRGGSEAACTELHNVQTAAAGALIDDADASDYQNFLLTTPNCVYTVDASSGVVSGQDCSAGTPVWPDCI